MHHPRIFTLAICGASLLGSSAWAASGSAGQAKSDPASQASSGSDAAPVPKDPRGVKGISPFWEEVSAGDTALMAGSKDIAITHYDEALKAEPKNPVGHCRMAEVRLAQDQLQEAQQSLDAAVRFAGDDAEVKAKALFLLADLAERQGKLPEARAAWKRYADHVAAHTEIKAYAASASERIQRIAAREDFQTKYAAVAARIKAAAADAKSK